jgi:hypothetical protein
VPEWDQEVRNVSRGSPIKLEGEEVMEGLRYSICCHLHKAGATNLMVGDGRSASATASDCPCTIVDGATGDACAFEPAANGTFYKDQKGEYCLHNWKQM